VARLGRAAPAAARGRARAAGGRGESDGRLEALLAEQRRLEELVRESQKLESVGRLAGGVAHDFNNILTVILGCLDGLDDGAGRVEIAEIRAAAGRARELTRQLLAFARRQPIAPVALEVGALLRDGERLAARLLGEDVVVSVDAGPGLWRVLADAGQLQQVVLNLAANARDAMPRGGTFVIRAANVAVDGAEAARVPGLAAGDHVLLSFADSGEGMPPDVRAHAFEPFFTTKAAGRGTGLGLATVWGIVKQVGGHVAVHSEPGRGTRFDVWLPRAPEGAATAPVRDPTPAPRGRGAERVLVVEDEPSVREVTVRSLRRAGYRVVEAGDAAAALAAAAASEEPIHLLVTDVVMPGMSGRDLAEALSRVRPALRVLYVSGYSHETIAHRGVLDEGIEFLQKPFTPASLLARVRQVLDGL
jgi:signal transduction histidine kinase/CheY-like chemotaxis protein